jgi:hypothetical protein
VTKKRPHIPVGTQLEVAYRQALALGAKAMREVAPIDETKGAQFNLDVMLDYLFGDELTQLDHDPALGLRKYNPKTGKWKPDANDPNYLIWRRKEEHRTKTIIRGEHGARSDIAEMKYRRRVAAKKKAKVQQRRKWPSRPIPKRRNPWPTRTQ